ncbi:MAG TPA: hypothetical protein VLG71_02760, partial [Candidatus Limnocylindria bacterium]|nr:hypothetical protein [Candidatus Limnocylindria bacterium]
MKAQRYSLLLGSFLGMASCSYGASVHVPPALQNFEKSVENAQHALVAFEQNPSVQSYRHVRSVLEAAKRNLTTLTEKFEVARRTNASWRGIPVLVQVHNDLPRYQEQFDVLESRVSAVLEGWLTRTQKAAEAVSMPAPVSQEPQPKKRTVKPVLSKKKVKAVKKKGKGIGAPVIPIPVDLATHQELAVLRQQVASLTQALEVLRATHAKELDDIEQQYRRRPYDGRGPADERIAQIKREAEHALAQAHTQAQAAQQQLQDDYVRLQQQLHSRGATEQELRQQLATLQQRRQEDQAHHAKALEQAHAEVAQKIQH